MVQVQVTAEMVKALREKTLISLSECKKALVEANGDQEEAIQILRKKGMSAGAKKSDRDAKEGVILTAEDNSCIVLVECNSETDFVSTSDRFREYVQDVVNQALKAKPATIEDLMKLPSGKEKGMNLEEARNLAVQALGENVQVRRFQFIPKGANKSYGIYSHGGGKLVVVVELDGVTGKEDVAKNVAMHAAAMSPAHLNRDSVPESVKASEHEIARSQIDPSKPAEMIKKIADGKVEKFFKEQCLIYQPFVKDTTKTVQQYIEANGAKAVSAFYRLQVGQS
jgi:elongation factor Ts